MTFKTFQIAYNNGNYILNGTRINMPAFINGETLSSYVLLLRTKDNVRLYIGIDSSGSVRQSKINGIILKYYVATNTLEVADNGETLIQITGTKFLTAI